MTDREAELPDEDRLVVPSTWNRHLPLRRGDGRTSKVEFDSVTAERWLSDVSLGKRRIRERLSKPENRDYAAGLAYLDGEPTPHGAAVVGLAVKDGHEAQGGRLRGLFAAMLREHGPAFAASSAVEYIDVHTPFRPERQPGADILTGWADSGWYWERVGPVLADIREFLIGLPDGEYAATVDAVAARRGTRAKRFASAVLLPEEPGWLDEACREYGNPEAAQYHPNWIIDAVLLPVIRTPEQLEAAGWPVLVDNHVTRSNIAALVHAAGKDSLPSLRKSVDQNLSAVPPLFAAIALIPSDEAMSFLFDCLDRPEEPSSVFEAMQAAARFPQRAQRIAAARAAGVSGKERKLLAMVARVALAAAPASDPETLDAIETLTGRDRSLPAAQVETLPRLLVAPPWAAKGAKPKRAAAHSAEAASGKALDPLEPAGVKVPKLPIWATPDQLPHVRLRDRKETLPREAVEHLLTMLSFAPIDPPYPGVEIVAEHCDPESLARFSWALFELWTALGAPTANRWALTQLSHFADDQVVRELTPLIAAWPGEHRHKRAITGLEVLGAIGTDVALHALCHIAETVKFKALKAKATEQIDAIAADLGLTTDQLGDRLVPDLGLDRNATLVLDYGARRFQVGFDEQLRPYLRDSDGKTRKSLPKPGADDDPDLANAARARFATLKKELKTVTKDLVTRLERAMIDGRTWTKAEFDEYLVRHPLVRHLTRRLVWLAETDGATTAFRIAEDDTCTDVEETELIPPDDSVIRLAHPVQLGDRLEAWTEVFADYEILQPFDQLNRPIMTFTEDELAAGRLTRFEGVTVEVGRILGMANRGWDRAWPEDGGLQPGVFHALPWSGFVTVTLDPGIYVGDVSEHPVQTVTRVRLRTDLRFEQFNVEESGFEVPSHVDPLAASEILAALARLAGTA